MRRVERHEDFAVRRSNRDAVAQRQVDVVGQADVVVDHRQLARRNHLADVVLDLLEIDLRLLDPRARRAPHVQPQLPCVDSWKEIAPDERVEEQ